MQNHIKKLILVVAALATLPLAAREIPVVKAEREGMSTERLQRIAKMNDRYTGPNKIAGTVTAVVRNGKIVHQSKSGLKTTGGEPIEMDDLFRIYSMTKPITATAAMQLYEQGKFQLSDPVSKFVPELAELSVLQDGELVPVKKQMTMQQLLSHTAGFSYGFNPKDPVDQAYRAADLFSSKDLDEFAQRVAKLPLKYQPGEQWHYSIAVDITGLVVQRLSGQPFDEYLQEHIFDPLDMRDTSFAVPEDKIDRFLPNHFLNPENGQSTLITPEILKSILLGENGQCAAMCDYTNVTLFSGGGGLVSTLRDYVRYAEAMRTGELDGVRILSPKTVAYMRANHLPASVSGGNSGEQPNLGNEPVGGFGFGLGFGIVTDTAAQGVMGSVGQYYWGGAAGTVFWIDPVENIVVVSMMQLMGGWPAYRPDLRVATYQAIIESNE